MDSRSEDNNSQLPVEERRLRIDEKRFNLDNSFARKRLPTLVTLMAGVIAGMFSYVQQQNSIQVTERTRIEAQAKDEREWGFKVIEMYFNKHELFDFTKNSEQASLNLRVLAAVAPTAVQGVFDAERSRILPPSGIDDSNRLAAVAGVQDALSNARQSLLVPGTGLKPSDFTIYVEYPDGGLDTAAKAQSLLVNLGYSVPGVEQWAGYPLTYKCAITFQTNACTQENLPSNWERRLTCQQAWTTQS
jgi:hypothetical protein